MQSDITQTSGEMDFIRHACRINIQASVWLLGGFGFFCSSSFLPAPEKNYGIFKVMHM